MKIKAVHIIWLVLLTAVLAGCPKPILTKEPPAGEETALPETTPEENPRVAASLQLTDQGRRLVADGKPDHAIRVLEQAVSLNPANGQNYYYLAEAWLMKGYASQAREFNQLAEIHLKQDRDWIIRVAKQADRIAELEK
jgi:tetratricopeptide (TPR) repeat protein